MVTTFSHHKSMGIFPDAQGQLTLQSVVVSCQILNSLKVLSFSSLPVRMKIQSKMKALEWLQHYTCTSIFRRSWAANSVVSVEMWPKFKSNQAFMVVLVTCKNDEGRH